MTIHFQNAPVVEIGITCWIEPSAEQPDWHNLAHALGEEFKEDYPHGETVYKNDLEIIEKTKFGFPKKGRLISHVRQVNFWSKHKDQLYTVGGNSFSFRRFRKEHSVDALHFANVLEESNRIFSRYVSEWTPQQIKQIAISYVDDLRIPIKSDIQIEEYLNLGIIAPFSPISFSDCELHFSLPTHEKFCGKMQVRFYRALSEESVFRMIFQWNCLIENINSMEMPLIHQGLEYGHQHCYNYFIACLTQKTKALFKPVSCE
jgi:uncharacterized protein (TIGR04255 family)